MSEREFDPDIVEHVSAVANRYGVTGLEELITLATERLAEARAALDELGEG